MKKPMMTLMIMFLVLLAGCTSTGSNTAKVALDPDPRVGEEVRQVCFIRNVDSWQNVDNDRRAVIVKMNNKDTYKLRLGGGCDPEWAMLHLAIGTRAGSSCFSRGDRIKTDGDTSRGYGTACSILGINKWDPEAVKPAEQQP